MVIECWMRFTWESCDFLVSDCKNLERWVATVIPFSAHVDMLEVHASRACYVNESYSLGETSLLDH